MAEHYHDDYLSNGEGRPPRRCTNRWVAWVGRTRAEQVNGWPDAAPGAGRELAELIARATARANRSRAQRERRQRERAEAERVALGEPGADPPAGGGSTSHV
jgi:hypothetical protein